MISNQNTSTDPQLSREEAIEILNTPDENLDELIARAEKLRRKYKGNHVSIHILTNARSGNCSQDCAYCAQSCRSKADIDKYKWVADEKLYADNDFVNEHHLSRHCIGLSGMKFTDAEIEELAEKIRKMKEQGTHLCCSIGFLTDSGLSMLLHIGIDTVSLNGEGFEVFVENGQKVKKGDPLMKIDIPFLTSHAPSLCSPVLCTELEENQRVRLLATGEVKAGDPLFAVDTVE